MNSVSFSTINFSNINRNNNNKVSFQGLVGHRELSQEEKLEFLEHKAHKLNVKIHDLNIPYNKFHKDLDELKKHRLIPLVDRREHKIMDIYLEKDDKKKRTKEKELDVIEKAIGKVNKNIANVSKKIDFFGKKIVVLGKELEKVEQGRDFLVGKLIGPVIDKRIPEEVSDYILGKYNDVAVIKAEYNPHSKDTSWHPGKPLYKYIVTRKSGRKISIYHSELVNEKVLAK